MPCRWFDAFFTALIFADVLVVLISLRYTDTYAVVFRNAGFALATVVLRLALVAPAVPGVLLGVGATAFASLARAELDHYRAEYEGFTSSVEIRDDIPGSSVTNAPSEKAAGFPAAFSRLKSR